MYFLLFVVFLSVEFGVATAKSETFSEDILFRQKLEHALNSYLPKQAKQEEHIKQQEAPSLQPPPHQGRQLGQPIRQGRQIQSSDGGATMYLPLGGQGHVRCPTAADAAAVSIAQMTFLSTTLNILSIVINVNNNINNNNNNNNKLNINAQSNNNIVTNTNVNNGNQVNVMVPVLNP